MCSAPHARKHSRKLNWQLLLRKERFARRKRRGSIRGSSSEQFLSRNTFCTAEASRKYSRKKSLRPTKLEGMKTTTHLLKHRKQTFWTDLSKHRLDVLSTVKTGGSWKASSVISLIEEIWGDMSRENPCGGTAYKNAWGPGKRHQLPAKKDVFFSSKQVVYCIVILIFYNFHSFSLLEDDGLSDCFSGIMI